MIWKRALKYPVLIMGIIMFVIYVSDPKTKHYWKKWKTRYIPNKCDTVVERAAPKAPKSWSFHCPETQLLLIRIPYEEKTGDSFSVSRTKMYRVLANSVEELSYISNLEAINHLKTIKFTIKSDRIQLLGKTDGEAIVEIRKFLYEYDIKKVTKKAKSKIGLSSKEAVPSNLQKKLEEIAKNLRKAEIEKNRKQLPQKLKHLVTVKEFR